MKKLLALLTMTATMMLAAAPGFAQEAAEDQYSPGEEEPGDPTTETFRGYADDVGLAGMRVDSDQSGEPCAGGPSWQVSFGEAETEFFVRRDGTDYPITIQDIGYGDFVEVSYTLEPNEVVPDICPAPISADSVTVLEAAPTEEPAEDPKEDPKEDPTDEPTDNPVEEPAGEPVEDSTGNPKEGSSVSVLPDTGGMSLALVGGALLSATGALLVRRIFR
ncbi:hypothetical protein BH24ACT22_BH24ACT22_01760 [soil metagenome]